LGFLVVVSTKPQTEKQLSLKDFVQYVVCFSDGARGGREMALFARQCRVLT
jgi:hypothetical protein